MINDQEDDLLKRCRRAENSYQDYKFKITHCDPEQIDYNRDQAKFWLAKYKTLKEELDLRDGIETDPDQVS